MRIVLAGSSGFIGTRLRAALADAGHEVRRLVRHEPADGTQSGWDPARGQLDGELLAGVDAAINLCGAGVGDQRWTPAYKTLIRSSRTEPTALLARGCADGGVPVLLNASAVGIYGSCGTRPVSETTAAGPGFLAGVCADWEAATRPATDAGVRVVNLRSGLVLGAEGGLLPRLALLTRLFLGGRLGTGRQYMSWVSATDEVAAIAHLLTADVHGPVNITAPEPVTNAEFTRELGRALRRPVPWVVPAPALAVALGGFASEVLGGQRAVPAALAESGFTFAHPTLPQALGEELLTPVGAARPATTRSG